MYFKNFYSLQIFQTNKLGSSNKVKSINKDKILPISALGIILYCIQTLEVVFTCCIFTYLEHFGFDREMFFFIIK